MELSCGLYSLAMIYVTLPDDRPRRLPFYLAMEEYLASMPGLEGSVMFMWQVDPTVICGRNQDVEKEVDLAYCRENSIDVVRRKSGGGCVFADRSNIMFSMVTPSADVCTTFSAYTGMIAGMLRAIGLDATDNSRNDILIGDRKVSGNAFYHLPGRSIVHGTMLYDIDPRHMGRAITPSRAKLESKGVKSVNSRLTTVREHSSITLPEFMAHARAWLCGNAEYRLTPDDVAAIEVLEQAYYRPGWLLRPLRHRSTAVTFSRHVEGVGEIRPDITLAPDGSIECINLTGDFFLLSDLDTSLLHRLKGVLPTREAMTSALAGVDASHTIAGLSTGRFIEILTENLKQTTIYE